MKKLVLILSMLLLVAGCKEKVQIKKSGELKNGVYSYVAKGKKSQFKVTVTIKEGKIDNIKIGDHNETPDKGGDAISKIPPIMVKKQTYEVDGISGATVTSEAIKKAVKECLEDASK